MTFSALPAPDAAFWDRLASASERLLLLDYDGTLAPFKEQRNQAFPYPGIRERLDGIIGKPGNRVVVVSGRALDHLEPLLQIPPPLEIWGSHGWEHRTPKGERELFPLDDERRALLDKAAEAADEAGFGEDVEGKPVSVAVHWRRQPEDEQRRREAWCLQEWTPATEKAKLELHGFNGGMELRALGRNKGDAVKTIMATAPEGAFAAYLGDDLTDEDAFAALDHRGVGILVRPEPRPTKARYWIQPPQSLLEFFDAFTSRTAETD